MTRKPGRDFILAKPAGVFEIDEPELAAMDENLRRFAITPDPAGGMNAGEKELESVQNFGGPPPRCFGWLHPSRGNEGFSRKMLQHEVTVPVLGKLTKNFRDRKNNFV
jgi:hypothetical protein